MFGNFIRTALRYLFRNRTYSTLNFMCLTFGLTCAVIAVLHIKNVFSYDKFHKNYKNLYEVESYVNFFNGERFPKDYQSASLTDALNGQAPEIEKMNRLTYTDYTFVFGDKSFNERGIYTDNNFFDMFTFPLIKGDAGNALSGNADIVISERMAIKLFESTDCIGKTLVVKKGKEQESFTVSGVIKNVPAQSWLQFDFMMPFSKFLAENSWANAAGCAAAEIWVQLRENSNMKTVEGKIKNLIKDQDASLNQELFLFPLKDKLLYRYAGGKKYWTEMQNVVIVGAVGLAILLIACFNFINLSIAVNIRRYREAGIKKVVGAKKSNIITQYLGETFLITLLSLLSAILVVRLLLPGFNAMFNKDVHLHLTDVNILLVFIAIALVTALISGLLPALYLASSNPLKVLKGNVVTNHSYSLFRQSLIVFQFTIPIVLIICMMIIRSQDKYMHDYNIGVDKEHLIVLNNTPGIQKHSGSVKTDLLAIPGVDAVSYTSCLPARGASPVNDVTWEGKDASEKLHFWCVNTDFDYNKTVDIKVAEGRFFDRAYSSDTTAYLINDIAAGVMKYDKPLGRSITVEGKKGTIIGVFKGFHGVDLRGPYVPTIIRLNSADKPDLIIRFSSGSYPSIAAKAGAVIKHYDPDVTCQPRLYADLDDFSELKMPSNLVGLAFIIALILACLGLFGLASFTTASRTKEIGIRKVNGATAATIVDLLLTNYSRWLIIASLTAIPFAYLLGQVFLRGFNFRTPLPYWAFLAGPVLAATVALLTVIMQSLRAATRNPVEALRYE
jgi:putative ABC transport system permease protein